MNTFSSLIFIDGGDPKETAEADKLLKSVGFPGVQGQTTNPTLVSKNPDVMKYLVDGKKLTNEEALAEYKKIVLSIAKVTDGPISIQVIGDQTAKKDDMLAQARVYKEWIPNGVIKFPCTHEGLAAAEVFCEEGPVNITLNFSQEQAAAVYVATKNAKHRVFISPFVGRLDDIGENGMDVVVNTLKMYQEKVEKSSESSKSREGSIAHFGHVEVLTASVRRVSHLLYALFLNSPAITVPYKTILEWQAMKFAQPMENFRYEGRDLKPIPYKELTLDRDWRDYDLHHDLTDKGLVKFMEDWTALLK